MNFWLLTIALFVPPAENAELASVVAAWNKSALQIETAEVELIVRRDSRDATFGALRDVRDCPVFHLRFDTSQRELKGPRLTAMRRDGRTQPAESDPDRARIEFRNVLLEEQLAGTQTVPQLQPVTLHIDDAGRERGQQFAPLDRLLIEAPLWAARPFWMVSEDRLAPLPNPDSAPDDDVIKLIEKHADHVTELWIEPRTPHRVIRVIQREGPRTVSQTDLTYPSGDGLLPGVCFVQTLAASGEALTFAEATLGPKTTLNHSLAHSPLGQLEQLNTDEPFPPRQSQIRQREWLRRALDSNWLPVALVALTAPLLLRRRPQSHLRSPRTREGEAPAEPPPESESPP